MSTEPYVVALDVGGSLTKIACVGSTGERGPVRRLPTPPLGAELVGWVAEQILDTVLTRPGDACVGYGVVVPGIIDGAAGIVRAAPNLLWADVPLRRQLADLTAMSGAIGHDVRSGGLAEWRLGAGAGGRNLLFLPLGTGIAGAVVVDGRMLDADGYAGEIGHLAVPTASERVCGCGQTGCLETVASASGVVRSYRRQVQSAPVDLDAGDLARLARGGDRAALQAFDRAAFALADALLAYLTLLGPELVVIGGGLADAADLFVPQVEKALQARVTFQRLPRIVPALLGADAGVVGAGLLGWDSVRGSGPTVRRTT